MSYSFSLIIGDDGEPKVVMAMGGVYEEGKETPAMQMGLAVMDAINTSVEELEEEGIQVNYILFNTLSKSKNS